MALTHIQKMVFVKSKLRGDDMNGLWLYGKDIKCRLNDF